MERILPVLEETMNKSFLSDLKAYLYRHRDSQSFSLYSDYCLDARDKFNNVISITIAPSWTVSPEIIEMLGSKIPKDLKKTNNISDETVEALTNKTFFHANFVINSLTGLLYQPDYSEQQVAIRDADVAIDMIKSWIINQPEGKENLKSRLRDLKSHAENYNASRQI